MEGRNYFNLGMLTTQEEGKEGRKGGGEEGYNLGIFTREWVGGREGRKMIEKYKMKGNILSPIFTLASLLPSTVSQLIN